MAFYLSQKEIQDKFLEWILWRPRKDISTICHKLYLCRIFNHLLIVKELTLSLTVKINYSPKLINFVIAMLIAKATMNEICIKRILVAHPTFIGLNHLKLEELNNYSLLIKSWSKVRWWTDLKPLRKRLRNKLIPLGSWNHKSMAQK